MGIDLYCSFMQTIFVSKAPFDLKPKEPVSEIPPAILKRCFGKQAPVVPHCQRLLAAATKEAKAGSGKAEGGDKGTANKSKTKQKKPKDKKTKKAKTEKKAGEPKRKIPYAEAKDLFTNKSQV